MNAEAVTDRLQGKACPHTITLYTNRNIMVFDREGKQLPEYQQISCYALCRKKVLELSRKAVRFRIAKYGEWEHVISRQEFEYLLGVRTLKTDIMES
jgi:hypothetical protein